MKTVESEAALGKGVLDEKRFSPAIYYLSIERFRGIKALSWHAAEGVSFSILPTQTFESIFFR